MPGELAKAMNGVMKSVGYVQKDAQMQGAGTYRYATEAAFISAVRPAMVENGIVVVPVNVEQIESENYETARGGKMHRMVCRITFRFTHVSGDALDVVTLGEGADAGDKCANKCMTAAMKYALRQAFLIETGNDPDDSPSHERVAQQPAKPAAPVNAHRPQLSGAADNPGARQAAIDAYAACPDMAAFREVGGRVRELKHAGKLSDADLAAVRGAAGAAQDRLAAAKA